jgi:Tol biopolymer transport system component
MKVRLILIGIGLILLVMIGLGLIAWNMKPQLVQTFPQAGDKDVPVAAPLRLEFSRPMLSETVTQLLKTEPAREGTFSWDGNTLIFTPDKPWPSGQTISVRLDAGARGASRLAFPMSEQSWSFTTGETLLAYLWPSNGLADIYALDPLTGDVRQFTQGMGVQDFDVSAHGVKIYFSASNSQGGSDLYRLDRLQAANNPDGLPTPEKLLDCGLAQCRSPVVSTNGVYLAYEYLIPSPQGGLGPAQIWFLDLSTMEALPIGQATHETVQPGWSSMGLLAYYDRNNNEYEVVDPLTGERTFLPNQTGQPGAWSPDGQFYLAPEIYYVQLSGQNERGTSHLIRYNVTTSVAEDLTQAEDLEDVNGVYSPDGGTIAFARKYLDVGRWTLGRQIWLMNADGSNSRQILNEPDYNHYDLAWSLDGRTIAYVRFNQAKLSDVPQLWLVNADGSNPVQLVIGGYSPQWIP